MTACGLSAVGEFVDGSRPTTDGGPPDGPFLLPDGAPVDGGRDAPGPDADPNAACLAVCDAGTCDAGTCVIECSDAASPCVTTDAVTCPPGVACAVRCTVKDACKVAVDCTQASRCDIVCSGEEACGPVACAGTDCHVTCGVDGGPKSCKGGVSCLASKECVIDCVSDKSCQAKLDVATDGGASVHCVAFDSCKDISVRAADASILCAADDSCEGVVTCAQAGACAFDCVLPNDKAISVCCPDGGCAGDSGACAAAEYECK